MHLNTQQQDSKTKAVFIDVRLCLYIWLVIKGQRDGIADWNIWTISFWPKFPLPRRWNVIEMHYTLDIVDHLEIIHLLLNKTNTSYIMSKMFFDLLLSHSNLF